MQKNDKNDVFLKKNWKWTKIGNNSNYNIDPRLQFVHMWKFLALWLRAADRKNIFNFQAVPKVDKIHLIKFRQTFGKEGIIKEIAERKPIRY
jgi:hypothetical protein